MDNLLNLLFRAASVEPDYQQEICLAAAEPRRSCTLCRDACPHDAIRITAAVEIDDVDCTGCGICIQVCPTGALEPRANYERGLPLRCSRVKGNARSITCLAQLQPTDLLRLADGDRVKLARAGCASCPVGGAAVPALVESVAGRASELASMRGRELAVEVVEVETFDEDLSGRTISRRELFRGGWRNLKVSTADVLAPLERVRPRDPAGEGDDEPQMPLEARRTLAWFRAVEPEPEELVPWYTPRVNEACIMCPSCTEACPTDAFARDFAPADDGGPILQLALDRCVGCGACVEACPVGAISFDERVGWAELSAGTQIAYRRRKRSVTGSRPTGVAGSGPGPNT